uniref:Putative senescence-associated protein n=1 Tax=Pisum sativum TaxID=3888 RepID=Q9AVH3_PEA|nr:putative senescence-associated protein [Pisum sativum]
MAPETAFLESKITRANESGLRAPRPFLLCPDKQGKGLWAPPGGTCRLVYPGKFGWSFAGHLETQFLFERRVESFAQDLLDQPNPADPAQTEGYHLFIQDTTEYKRRVRLQAKQYPPLICNTLLSTILRIYCWYWDVSLFIRSNCSVVIIGTHNMQTPMFSLSCLLSDLDEMLIYIHKQCGSQPMSSCWCLSVPYVWLYISYLLGDYCNELCVFSPGLPGLGRQASLAPFFLFLRCGLPTFVTEFPRCGFFTPK